ncbi:hypothetical protein ABIB57_004205 [Devosia sp. UYZn731]|uniref:DUF4267 domain-containing protein n=1 Tax=Devosia sp. UYZn731 TaxID=3156345 RepID=UPI003399DE55
MTWFVMGGALVVALAIIAIGISYLANPIAMAGGFGLPLPGDGTNVPWWLRLKGVRDVVSGTLVIAFMIWGSSTNVGIVLAVEAMIPLGDMLLVLAAKGSTGRALGIHGTTAAFMIVIAILMLTGVR